MSHGAPVVVRGGSITSSLNSSTANLGGGGSYTGAWEDTEGFGSVVLGIKADQDSATDGLVIEYSADGTTVHDLDSYSILANVGKVYSVTSSFRFLRVRYTNGATPTTMLAIQVRKFVFGFKSSSHRIQDNIVGNDDAQLVKAVLAAERPDGEIPNIGCTNDGNLRVSLEVDADSEHKFGFQNSIGKVVRWVVWDKAAAYPAWPGNGTLTVVAEKVADTSIGIEITGVGPSPTYAQVSDTITTDAADGTTPSATGASETFSDTFRAAVVSGAAPTGYISVLRGGTEVLRIQQDFGQTQTCRWVVPGEIDGVTYSGCRLKEINLNVGATDKANVYLTAKTPTDVMSRVKRYYGNVQGAISERFTNGGTIAGLFFPPGTVLAVEAIALNTTAEVSASLLAGMEL